MSRGVRRCDCYEERAEHELGVVGESVTSEAVQRQRDKVRYTLLGSDKAPGRRPPGSRPRRGRADLPWLRGQRAGGRALRPAAGGGRREFSLQLEISFAVFLMKRVAMHTIQISMLLKFQFVKFQFY